LNNVVSKFVNVTPLHNLSRSAIRSIQNPVGVVVIMFAKNIAPFIGTIVLKVLPLVTELVVVDDGSDDQTAEIATRAGALVLRQPKELGKFKTFYEGLRVAETFNPQAIIYVDGTYGFVDSDISTLSEPILVGNADVVVRADSSLVERTRVGRLISGKMMASHLRRVLIGDDPSSRIIGFSPQAAKLLYSTITSPTVLKTRGLTESSNLRVQKSSITSDSTKQYGRAEKIATPRVPTQQPEIHRPLLLYSVPGALMTGIGVLLGVDTVQHAANAEELILGLLAFTAGLTAIGMTSMLMGLFLHTKARALTSSSA
jgi:hypothetical protein